MMQSSGEAGIKEERVREYMAARNLDGVVLSRQENFAWFTCGGDNRVVTTSERGVASVVISRDSVWVVTDNIEAPRMDAEEVSDQYDIVHHPWHQEERRAAIISRILDTERGASDDGTAGMRLLDADFAELRYCLTEDEMQRYRDLARDCSAATSRTLKEIEPGQTEAEIAGRMAAAVMPLGITPVVLLVGSDERIGEYRHPIYTQKPVERAVMLALCGQRSGLVCSLTRLVHFGKTPQELAARHRAVCAVDAAFVLETRLGAQTGAILQAGLQAYKETGFAGEWELHHQGGATGYAPREYKVLPGDRRTVGPNQAFAWNPSITGTKSEDTLLAVEEGLELISQPVDWPTVTVEYKGVKLERADILER